MGSAGGGGPDDEGGVSVTRPQPAQGLHWVYLGQRRANVPGPPWEIRLPSPDTENGAGQRRAVGIREPTTPPHQPQMDCLGRTNSYAES